MYFRFKDFKVMHGCIQSMWAYDDLDGHKHTLFAMYSSGDDHECRIDNPDNRDTAWREQRFIFLILYKLEAEWSISNRHSGGFSGPLARLAGIEAPEQNSRNLHDKPTEL